MSRYHSARRPWKWFRPAGHRPSCNKRGQFERLENRDLLSITFAGGGVEIDCNKASPNAKAYEDHAIWFVCLADRIQIWSSGNKNGAAGTLTEEFHANYANPNNPLPLSPFIVNIKALRETGTAAKDREGSTIDCTGLRFDAGCWPIVPAGMSGQLLINVIGSDGPDTIRGADGISAVRIVKNTLNGMDGDDTITGGGGGDSWGNGAADDTLIGGKGMDILDGASGKDTINGRDGLANDFVETYDDSSNSMVTDVLTPPFTAPLVYSPPGDLISAYDGCVDKILYDPGVAGTPPAGAPPGGAPGPQGPTGTASSPGLPTDGDQPDGSGTDSLGTTGLSSMAMKMGFGTETTPLGEGGQTAGTPNLTALDAAFGEYGAATMGIGDAGTTAADVAVANGKIFVASKVDRGFSRGTEFALQRLDEYGTAGGTGLSILLAPAVLSFGFVVGRPAG
jgi:Ca2+-binding RTX toxin-like protein